MVVIAKPEKVDEEAVGCIIVHGSRFLLTHRAKDGLWGSIAESIEEGETPEQAVRRGLEEELGLEKEMPIYFTTTYHQYGDRKIAYHIFELRFQDQPADFEFNTREIKELGLFTLDEALNLDLYEDEDHCLKLYSEERMRP